MIREARRGLQHELAYGVEFLEVDAKVLGTETWQDVPDAETRTALERHFTGPTPLKAMHGSPS